MSPHNFLGLIGGIIILGFISDMVFKRFNIPPTLTLLTVGFMLTNIFHLFDPEKVLIFAPYFGTMAFAIILFEGGLALDIYSLVKKLGIAFLFGTMIFLLTALSLTIFWVLFGGDPYIGAVIGIMLGGTGGAIVIPIISKLKVSEEVKTVAKMEGILAEIFIVVGVSVILGMIKGKGEFNIPSYLFNSVVNSTLIGIFVGVVWLQVIKVLAKNEIYYILTLAVLFGTYWFVEFIHANGPLSALVFGMVISNTGKVMAKILPFLRIDEEKIKILNFSIDEFTRRVSVELSFVFSTFFFLMLGMVVKFEYLLDWNIISAIFGFSLIIITTRIFMTFLVYLVDKDIKRPKEALTLFFMMPRGLVTAIVAFNVGSVLPQYGNLLLSYAFGVILVSVIIMTFGTFLTKYVGGGE